MQIPNLGGKYMVRGRCNHAKAGCPNSFRYSPIAAGIKAVTGALPRNAPDVRRWPRLMSVIDFYHLAHRTHDAVATLSLLLFLGRRSARHETCETSMQPATPHGRSRSLASALGPRSRSMARSNTYPLQSTFCR